MWWCFVLSPTEKPFSTQNQTKPSFKLNFIWVFFLASHNQLSSLPVEMFTLKNLRCLTLQQNLLENLPEELGQLQNLTELVKSDRLTGRNHVSVCLQYS